MRVDCFIRLPQDGAEADKTYESDGVSFKTITPEHHEVIVTVDDKELGKTVEKLLEVLGEDRQGTSPERYAAIQVWDGDTLVRRLTVTGEAYELPAAGEKTYTDAELRGILNDRQVKYPRNAKTDQLMALVLDNGGLSVEEAAEPVEGTEANEAANNGEDKVEGA